MLLQAAMASLKVAMSAVYSLSTSVTCKPFEAQPLVYYLLLLICFCLEIQRTPLIITIDFTQLLVPC